MFWHFVEKKLKKLRKNSERKPSNINKLVQNLNKMVENQLNSEN